MKTRTRNEDNIKNQHVSHHPSIERVQKNVTYCDRIHHIASYLVYRNIEILIRMTKEETVSHVPTHYQQ